MITMKDLRNKVGLSQAQVARELGLAESTIRNWERGRSIPTLPATDYPKLLKLYQCSPEELAMAAEASRQIYDLKKG